MKTRHSAAHAPPAAKLFATTGRQTNADQPVAASKTELNKARKAS